MKLHKPNMNIKTIQISKNKISSKNEILNDKKSYLKNPFILQLLDKEHKNKKSRINEKNFNSKFSYRNYSKGNSNIPNSEINSINIPKGTKKNNINIGLKLNNEIINNNYYNKKVKHHSSDQIYNDSSKNNLKKKDKQIIQLQKALMKSENLLNQLQNNKSIFPNKKNDTIIKNNSKNILNLKISKKHHFSPSTFNSMTTTNSNYISNEQNYSSLFSNPSSPKRKILSNRLFTPTQNYNIKNSSENYNLNNGTFTPENKKNKYIFENKFNKENSSQEIINNSRSDNFNFEMKNNLEKLKLKTKKVLDAYLTFINKEK